MNSLDRAIAFIAPERALRRLQARAAIAMGQRAYEAAKRDRSVQGWTATGSSANAENLAALSVTRERARDLVRNNPYAANLVRKLATNIVGKGITPTARTSDEARRDVLRRNWEAFVANSDPEGLTNFYGQVSLAVRTVAESGECLIRWIPANPKKIGTPLQCEIIEPDYLDTTKNMEIDGGGLIVQGVEYDAQGRRVAYWLFERHPGDNVLVRGGLMATSQRRLTSEYTHMFDRLRAQQIRGVTWLAPVAVDMRDVDDFEYAERLRKKISACFGVFIQRDDLTDPVPLGATASESAVGPDGMTPTTRALEKVSPGIINYLRGGETPTLITPPEAQGYGDYMVIQLQAIAAGVGVPYHTMTGDLRQANYSSLREGKLDFWGLIDHWQSFMVIPQACDGAWSRVHAANLRWELGPEIWSPADWIVPRRPWVDPLKDMTAEALEMKLALKSYPMALHERGLMPEEIFAQLQKWTPELASIGFDVTQKSGGAPAPADAQSTDGNQNDQTSAAA